jgi:hypothetical protein
MTNLPTPPAEPGAFTLTDLRRGIDITYAPIALSTVPPCGRCGAAGQIVAAVLQRTTTYIGATVPGAQTTNYRCRRCAQIEAALYGQQLPAITPYQGGTA